MTIKKGTRLGSYEILALSGSGGAAVVYKARDLKLGRHVAVKVLHKEFSADREKLKRFEKEARSASALNHPNIVHIYDIGEYEATHYIAMEFVEGKTLREILSKGPLPPKTILKLATQLADGLAKAHGAGIIHRDLKPENLMVTPDGFLKVVDFGLAKLVADDLSRVTDSTRTPDRQTPAGVTRGTFAYMSPEQALGRPIDHRTDQFSFGSILYEMATGKLAFARDSVAEMLAAIIKEEPEELVSGAVPLPDQLVLVLERCLAKDPEERYDSSRDLAKELKSLEYLVRTGLTTLSSARAFLDTRDDGPVSERLTLSDSLKRIWTRPTFWLGAAAVALAAVIGWIYLRPSLKGGAVVRLTNPVQVTSTTGLEDHPAWSPDTRTLAYAATQGGVYGGNWDIWVTQLGGGSPVNRTSDHTGEDRYPSLSPDGSQIAFWSNRDGGGYFVMPVLGGQPRKVAHTGLLSANTFASFSPAQWSGDGKELALLTVGADTVGPMVEIMCLDTTDTRRMALPDPKNRPRFDLSWSPDARFFAYVTAVGLTADVSQIWLLRCDDGQAFPVSNGFSKDWSPTWSPDGRRLFYVSNRGGSMDLWQQQVSDNGPVGPPQRVTAGVGMRRASFSRDGSKLAYSKGQRVANLWQVPIQDGRPTTWDDATQLTFDQAFIEFVDVSADGRRLLFSSDRTGNQDIWMLPIEGGEMQQLTTHHSPDWAPRWSPDQRYFAFYSYRSGNRDIWVMPASGGRPRQLTNDDAVDAYPSWSPDGEQIAFVSDRSGNSDVWIVGSEGGIPRRVTSSPAIDSFPQWSPDGKSLLFASDRSGNLLLYRMSLEGGSPVALSQHGALYPRWAENGRQIYFTGAGEGSGTLWIMNVEDGRVRRLTDLSGRRGDLGIVALAAHGDHLFFTWEEEVGDIWVMDVADAKPP